MTALVVIAYVLVGLVVAWYVVRELPADEDAFTVGMVFLTVGIIGWPVVALMAAIHVLGTLLKARL